MQLKNEALIGLSLARQEKSETQTLSCAAQSGADSSWLLKLSSDAGLENGSLFACFAHKVVFGLLKNGNLQFEPSFVPEWSLLTELRVFDESGELRLWKSGDGFSGRIRIDGQGGSAAWTETTQTLWGTRSEPVAGNPDWLVVTEDRGTRLTIPIAAVAGGKVRNQVFLQSRHYIEYNELGQAGYVDSRWITLTGGVAE